MSRPGAGIAPRANPVAILVAGDEIAAALAASIWVAGFPQARPALAILGVVVCVPLLALARAYQAPFPRQLGVGLPVACLGLAPAMAGPFRAEDGVTSDAVGPLLWLAALIVIAAAVGRGLMAGLLFHSAGARFARRVALLGEGRECARAVQELVAAERGRLLGFAAAQPAADAGGLPCLGDIDTLLALAREGGLDEVILTPGHLSSLLAIVCVPVAVTLAVPVAGRVRMVGLCAAPLSNGQAVAKRVLDVVIAATALAVFAVPMALVALAVALDSAGPVLFRQQRGGLAGRSFELIKFRTMRADAADPDGARQTAKNDPRLTPVGRILRRTSMDELPQLLNVLRGEMSLVGPRPHAWGSRAGWQRFEEVIGGYPARHRVRPGLTGLAQVRGYRGPITDAAGLRARTLSDLEYARAWSLPRDLAILLRTAWVVLTMRNAQ